jgi:3-methyladenine DNA glycosylase AlkD
VPCVAAETALVTRIRAALGAQADPERAAAQQRYMKSAMPYRGLTMSLVRTTVRQELSGLRWDHRSDWEDTLLALWDEAAFREERYAGLALARHRSARAFQDPDAIPLYGHLVVTGAWWDLVDEIATHLVGDVLLAHRDEVTPVVRAWARDDDLWLRRTAVLCQVRHRERTDTDLLRAVVEANLDDPSFWLRKAIGWALRSHAHTDPGWVRAEVAAAGGRISGLSRREALKHLGDGG